MKTYILTVDEGYGEYVYAVFAETFRDAYEKIKNDEEFEELKEYYNSLENYAEED